MTEPETASETESLIGLCCFRTLASDWPCCRTEKNLKHSYMLTQRSSGPAAAGAVVAARPTSVHPEDAHGAPVPHRPHGAALKLVANVEGLHLQMGSQGDTSGW